MKQFTDKNSTEKNMKTKVKKILAINLMSYAQQGEMAWITFKQTFKGTK